MTRIPGLGEVDWPESKIEAHAVLVGRTHRPDRSPVTIRWRWFLPVPTRRSCGCVSCLKEWPCPEMKWAEDWLASHRYHHIIAD